MRAEDIDSGESYRVYCYIDWNGVSAWLPQICGVSSSEPQHEFQSSLDGSAPHRIAIASEHLTFRNHFYPRAGGWARRSRRASR